MRPDEIIKTYQLNTVVKSLWKHCIDSITQNISCLKISLSHKLWCSRMNQCSMITIAMTANVLLLPPYYIFEYFINGSRHASSNFELSWLIS